MKFWSVFFINYPLHAKIHPIIMSTLCWLLKVLQWWALNWRGTWLNNILFTSPNNSTSLGSAALSWFGIFDEYIQDYQYYKACEMQKANDCRVNIRNIYDYKSNGADMLRDDDGKINVPCFHVPLLNKLRNTLLSPYSYAALGSGLSGLSTYSSS